MLIEKLMAGIIAILAVLTLVFGLAAASYHRLYKADELALKTQSAAIQARNDEAKTQLATLTKQRDDAQRGLDQAKQDQEKKDELATTAIAAARAAAADVPVRVRIASDAGGGGDRPAGQGPWTHRVGSLDTATSGGVLAPKNSRLIDDAIADIETLQAAFNACKAKALPP
jgi:hypothetical protein